MRKALSVVLILAFPALVAADINRLNPNPDLERPDARTWQLRPHESGLVLPSSPLPVWKGAFAPVTPGCGTGRVACPSSLPGHVAKRTVQPDNRTPVLAPILWPHSPRADEVRTVAREPRPGQARRGDTQPAN